jgi:outer membrane murein-binding lipoprotein Lpp
MQTKLASLLSFSVLLLLVACGVDRAEYEQLQKKCATLETKVANLEEEKKHIQAELEALRATPEGAWDQITRLQESQRWGELVTLSDDFPLRWPTSPLVPEVKKVRSSARSRLAEELYNKAQAQTTKGDPAAKVTLETIVRDYGDTSYGQRATSDLRVVEKKIADAKRQMEWQEEERREQKEKAASSLELLRFSWSKEYGYVTVEGLVKNISGARIEGVQAVAIFTDASGNFVSSDSAMIEYQPILVNQSSPFKVMATWNPEMKKCRVEFKTLFGGQLPTYHSWTKKKG